MLTKENKKKNIDKNFFTDVNYIIKICHQTMKFVLKHDLTGACCCI